MQSQNPVDFTKIQHWTGEGENEAALMIQFNTYVKDRKAHVWGYRWHAGETRTGEDMFRDICANSKELCLLTQMTGQYGCTVDGIGYTDSGEIENLLSCVYFDFEKAKNYRFINFKYYGEKTEIDYGQRDFPGDETPVLCANAVEKAVTSGSHVIQHPIDYTSYGYPAYDYDCWFLDNDNPNYDPSFQWIAAWYSGYWSYYLFSPGMEDFSYSGVGYSGRTLSDGCVDAWSFCKFDEDKIGGFGEGIPPYTDPAKIDYRVQDVIASGMFELEYDKCDLIDKNKQYYNLQGIRLATPPKRGFYIEISDGKVYKKSSK